MTTGDRTVLITDNNRARTPCRGAPGHTVLIPDSYRPWAPCRGAPQSGAADRRSKPRAKCAEARRGLARGGPNCRGASKTPTEARTNAESRGRYEQGPNRSFLAKHSCAAAPPWAPRKIDMRPVPAHL